MESYLPYFCFKQGWKLFVQVLPMEDKYRRTSNKPYCIRDRSPCTWLWELLRPEASWIMGSDLIHWYHSGNLEAQRKHARSKGHTKQQLPRWGLVLFPFPGIARGMRLDNSSKSNAYSWGSPASQGNHVLCQPQIVVLYRLHWGFGGMLGNIKQLLGYRITLSTPKWRSCLKCK
jgi:hypothetical protein